MYRLAAWVLVLLSCQTAVLARHDTTVCATTRDTAAESVFLHRQSTRARRLRPAALAAPAAPPADRDIGNIAILEDTNGVVERLNQFNLDGRSLVFTPS